MLVPDSFSEFFMVCKDLTDLNPFDKSFSHITFVSDVPRFIDQKPDFLTMPLVSSVHVSLGERKPWTFRRKRPYLVSYGASLEGQPYAQIIRSKLLNQCKKNSEDCLLVHYQIMASHIQEALDAKKKSIFCLEPPGFGPHRKSQIDSILLGCIPVFFQNDSDICPNHWNSWREESRILLSVKDADTVIELLKKIPRSVIRAMQNSISANAWRLHYSLTAEEDAITIALMPYMQIKSLRS